MPSLQETTSSEVVYVNTDVISDFIAEEAAASEVTIQERPKSVAEISQNKKHVCEIKIMDDSAIIQQRPIKAKRSASSVSSTRPLPKSDKASRFKFFFFLIIP
jgi:hypothetical protein